MSEIHNCQILNNYIERCAFDRFLFISGRHLEFWLLYGIIIFNV